MVLDTGSVLIAIFPVEIAATSLYFWILPVIAVVGLVIGGGKTVYSLTKQRADEKAERRKYGTLQVGGSACRLSAPHPTFEPYALSLCRPALTRILKWRM